MKKYIFTIAAFFGMFMLSGCGGSDNISNSGETASETGNPAVDMQLTAMQISGDHFTIPVSFIKKLDNSYMVELNSFDMTVDGCTLTSKPIFSPDSLPLNGGVGSKGLVNITGTFDPSSCTPTKYLFSATQTVTKDGKTDTRKFSVKYDPNNTGSGTTPIPSSGFFNATTPLEITQANTAYEIKVQMLEDGYVASGKVVKMKPFDRQYGEVSNHEATTGADGYAVFPYTSPITLPADGTFVPLELTHDDNGTILTENIVLKFNSIAVPTVSDMFISPLSFTITAPGEEKNITISTVNTQNVGISTTVQFENPNNGTDYGYFDNSPVTTNTSGYAVVKYTAPQNISGLLERNIIIIESSKLITQILNIKFDQATSSNRYEIVGIAPGSFAVDSKDSLTIKIVNIATKQLIDDTDVLDVNLTSKFTNMLLFQGATSSVNYNGSASRVIGIESQKLSGVGIVEVSAEIFDGKDKITLTNAIPVTILSGPVTALSMHYNGTFVHCVTANLPRNDYVVHAVDKYNNPAIGVKVTPTLIVEMKQNSQVAGTGTINGDGTIGGTSFSDTGKFANILASTDRLIITVDVAKEDQRYLGNWSMDATTNDSLNLSEAYTGPGTSALKYVIGDEDKVLGGNLNTAHIVDPKGTYLTDGNGTLDLEGCFDAGLMGHTITLGSYVIDRGIRTGIGYVDNVRWPTYTSETLTIQNYASNTGVYSLRLGIGGTNIAEDLIDLDIDSRAFHIETKPHCTIDVAQSTYHTNDGGNVQLYINMDGNRSATGGVDECTVQWNTNPGSILREY